MPPLRYPAPGVNQYLVTDDGAGQQIPAELTPEQYQSTLAMLASRGVQTLENVGLLLDTPGALARGVLAGDPLSGLNWDFDKRTSGEELNEALGISPDKKALGGWGRGLAGFATEVITDPLFLFQGGLGAMGKAARAAEAADILQYAPKAATRKLGPDAAAKISAASQTMTGRSTIDRLIKNRIPQTESTLDVMPVIGPRLSRYRTTLSDVVKASPPSRRGEVMEQLRNYLGSDEAVQEQMGERLGDLFGFGFGQSAATFSPFSEKTTESILDALDYVGQATRWSAPMRYGASLFDNRMAPGSTVADQVDALKAYKTIGEQAKGRGNLLATAHGQLLRDVKLTDKAKTMLGADSLMSLEGNDFLLRLSNEKPTAEDILLANEIPSINNVVANWRATAEAAVEDARSMGLKLPEYRDAYGNAYSPRHGMEFEQGLYRGGGSALERSANVENQIHRNVALALPGGDIDVREVSRLPKVREHAMRKFDSPYTDEEVGQEIAEYIVGKHGNPMVTLEQATAAARGFKQAQEVAERTGKPFIQPPPATVQGISSAADLARAKDNLNARRAARGAQATTDTDPFTNIKVDQSTEIARIMRHLDKNLPEDVPAFSEHPIISQMRYIVNNEVRKATANHVFDSMAEHALYGRHTAQTGQAYRDLEEVMSKYAGRLGFVEAQFGRVKEEVATQIEERIARRSGIDLYIRDKDGNIVGKNVHLKDYFVPEEVADRLGRIADFYNVPQAQEEVASMFNVWQTLFKGFTLSYPSRFSRDAYSNLASLWLETGDAVGSIAGMWNASHIMAGNPEKAIAYLSTIPRYRQYVVNGVPDAQAIIRQMERDVGENGVLSGLATSDLLTGSREGKISQFIPGSFPVSISQGIRELVPDGSRTAGQMAQDFGTIRGFTNTYETRNQILKAGEKVGDAVDSAARLGGFLALMRQGIGPQQAAKRMKRALVDYSSLTQFERHWMKNIFLWWSYQSRIGKYAVDSLYQNPGGRFAQMIRGVNDLQRPDPESGYVPTAVRQQVGVRLPDWAQFNPGTTTYLTNIDLPALDVINILKPAPYGQYFPINVQATVGELLNQSNPLFKTIAETATGTDLFSKRPLSEARNNVDKVWAAMTGNPQDRADPMVKAVIQNLPLPLRPFSVLGQLVDPNIENPWYRAGKIFVNETTGLHTMDVEPEFEKMDARNKVGDFLKRFQNTYTIRNIPAESVPFLPPEALLLNEVDKQLQREISDYRKQKKAEQEAEKLLNMR